jgi:hypothetical protein
MRKKLIISGVMTAAVLAVGVTTVSQAYINPDVEVRHDKVGIGVSPLKADRINMVPGGKYDGRFRIYQNGDETADVVAEISPLTAYKNYEVETDRTQITKWTTFDLEGCDVNETKDGAIYFAMRSQEECYINYHISVPYNAMGGSQDSAIMVRTMAREDVGSTSGNSGVNYQYQFAYLVYSDVDGPGAKYDGKVIDNDIPWLLFSPPLGVESTVDNTGNLDFTTKYEVTMNDWFGGKQVYERSWDNIAFAESKHVDGTKWENAPTLGLYNVQQKVAILDEQTDNQTLSERTQLVLIVPIWLIIIIFAVIALLIWALYLKIRGHRNRPVSRSDE